MPVMSDKRGVPADLLEGTAAAREYDIPYSRLRSWWTRGRIMKYLRGDGRVYVSRAAIVRMMQIEPAPPDASDASEDADASE